MRKTPAFLVFLLFLSLAACSSPTSDTPEVTLEPLVTSEDASSELNVETSPTLPTTSPTQTDSPEEDSTTEALLGGESMGGCTLASIFPEANPTEQSLFPAPDENDWSKGPETAAVTIVEYGDFQ